MFIVFASMVKVFWHEFEYMQQTRGRGYKTFFVLNSTEREINHAHNIKMPTSVGILTLMSMINTTSESLNASKVFSFQYFSFHE